jgi:hypothetical protein
VVFMHKIIETIMLLITIWIIIRLALKLLLGDNDNDRT